MNSSGDRTIILVHGWPLTHEMYEYQIPILLKLNYRIITYDIRGFGNSEVTDTGYNYNQFSTDLYYIIRSLNLSNFDLLGFSMGGAIVTRYMRLYQGYGVRKLCLCDAAVPSYCKTINNPYGQTIESTNQLIKLGFDDRPLLNEFFGKIFFYKKNSGPFINWMQNLTDSSSGLGEMSSLIALKNENLIGDLSYIKVPTGIFHGREDKICSFKIAEIMNSYIENSKLFPIDEAGHGAFYEQKDKFNDLLVKFLYK